VRSSPGYFGAPRPKSPVRYGTQSEQLKYIRAERPDIKRWSFSSEQATLRRLNKAFDGFFRRMEAGGTPGYPRFKSAPRFDNVEWPADGDGCRWKPHVSRVYLQGVGDVHVTAHRQVEGRVKTLQVKREGRRWFVILSCDDVPKGLLEPTHRAVGIDVGIACFAVTSDARRVDNPRWGRTAAEGLASAQQVLVRKKRGSNNRRRARETVASRHRKVANQRRDFHHKTARELVAGHDVLVVEDLRPKSMTRRARPRPDPDAPGAFLPNGQAAKTGLNRSIMDAGWGAFVAILEAKAEEAGRRVVAVDPRHTPDRCEACGHTARDNRVSQAVFRCQHCGHQAHADEHAARNILRAGLALLAAEQSEAA
jgi:putative transposase